ncbi:MAG: ABC transporter substrate-binding protein [Alphaproteobacteria bacterium]
MTITLFENFRAVFYLPFYATHALGAYAAEGVDVRLETSPSPEASATSLLNHDTDVSWGGPMRVLLTHDRLPDCGLVGFCEVVTRDPFFIIGREARPGFDLRNLRDMRIGTVSEVPTPWLCLQDDLRRLDLDPDSLDRVADRSMAENEAALRDGSLDAIQVFQPYAEHLIRDGAGHILHAAANRGSCSYTTLYTTWHTLETRRDSLLAMTRAIYRMQKWLHGQPDAVVAETVASYFPGLERPVLEAIIARYRALGIWGRNPILPRGGFERLKASCLSGGLISRGADYAECVDTSLAEQVVREDPAAMAGPS